MKTNLLRLFGCFCLFYFISFSTKAQLGLVKKPGIMLGGNFIYAAPSGQFSNSFNFGLGGELYAGFAMGSTYLVGSLGVTGYHSTSPGFNTMSTAPIKIGLKKYFLLKKLFLNGDVGSTSVKVNSANTRAFTADIGGGIKLLGLEASINYNTFKNTFGYESSGFSNSMNIKLGWNFSL